MSSRLKDDQHVDWSALHDIPLLILHPNFHEQHRILPDLMNREGYSILFVTLDHENTSAAELCTIIERACAEQLEINVETNDKTWPHTISQQLAPFAPYCLIFDAYDLTDDAETAPVIAALVDALPPGSQIVLSGRRLPLTLIHNEQLQAKTVLLPINEIEMIIDYTRQPPDRLLLEVYGLGAGRTLINGAPIRHWDGILPRALFFFLVDRGMTTRDEIFQTFWPTLPIREATNVFHVTKRKVSEILGFDLTTYWSGFYRISPNVDLHYDVVKFAEAVQNSAVAPDDEAIAMLRGAISLYRGGFLSTLDADWVHERRVELRGTYADALAALARLYEKQNQDESALGLYVRAATSQPQREDLARSIMSLYQKIGQPERALEVYDRLTDTLKRALNVSPDKRTNELVTQVRRQLRY